MSDLKALVKECELYADSMDHQSQSSKSGSGIGGHPNPVFFFSKVGSVLRNAADELKKHIPPEPVQDPNAGAPASADNKPAVDPKPTPVKAGDKSSR